MRMTDWMGAGSAGYLHGVALTLSLISLTTVWFGFVWGKRTAGVAAAILAAGCCAIWYDLVDFAPRALSEVLATHLLLPGLYLGVYGEELPERKRLFLAGILCGVALSLRIQLTPTIAFAAVYFCRSDWRKRAFPVAAGFLLPILSFGVVDMLTWSYPFQSFVRYFWVDVVEGRTVAFGVKPWYWYLTILLRDLGPMLLFAAAGVRRSPLLGGLALITLAAHSAVGHKETRYIYSVISILIILAALGMAEVASWLTNRGRSRPALRAAVVAGLVFCAVTSWLMAPRFLYWDKNSGTMVAFDRLSEDSDTCGVGLYGVPWFYTGGYTHLHRNVPIIPVSNPLELDAHVPNFNRLVAPARLADLPPAFSIDSCWNGICLYRRSGSCASSHPQDEINAFLLKTGN